MISVVIPTLNEAARLPRLLGRLAAEPTPHEVVVVDGGSDDATVFAAHAAEARVLCAGPGQQLAAGADAASGDTLLFLHADSRFPAGGLARIEATLARHPDCPGGNFRLIFDGDTPFSRWLTGFYARIRAHGLYYGDSGVFVRRRVYDEIGGMRPIEVMEDYDFTRRLERRGQTRTIEEPPLVTSSRRFEGRRPFAIVVGWLEIHALYHLGVPPRLLARRYEAQRRRSRKSLSLLREADG
jgi:rSAM/selenodomain-associated transferase 2